MKKILILIFVSAVFVSCEDWLAVKPFDALEQGEVFLNERNANAALNGLYLDLTAGDLYFREMSCGMLEVMAQHYLVPAGTNSDHKYKTLNEFNYTDKGPKGMFEKTFSAAYKSISNCNEFLEKIQDRKDDYEAAKYALYQGEAIALRTFLHFDMLRLFGPKGDELDRASVPYYDVSTSTPQPILTAEKLIDILLEDIDVAIDYLKYDPILAVGVDVNYNNINFFTGFRNMRMNYYAANALKARMLLYKGTDESKTEAYKVATALIEDKRPENLSVGTNFSEAFKFETSANYLVYPDEIIFGIQNTQRSALDRTLFGSSLDNSTVLSGGSKFIGYLYMGDNSAPAGADPGSRAKMWSLDNNRNSYNFCRFNVKLEQSAYPYYNQYQCLIRLGEIYAIAAETAPTLDLKKSWLEKLRTGKGYDPGNMTGADEAKTNTILNMEFEKETFGEGQFFFYAKRKLMNLRDSGNGSVTMDRGRFVPALPDAETYYRNSDTTVAE